MVGLLGWASSGPTSLDLNALQTAAVPLAMTLWLEIVSIPGAKNRSYGWGIDRVRGLVGGAVEQVWKVGWKTLLGVVVVLLVMDPAVVDGMGRMA